MMINTATAANNTTGGNMIGADNLPLGPSLQLGNEVEVVRKAGRHAIRPS